MNLYFTIEPQAKIKSVLANVKSFYIIDMDEIRKENGIKSSQALRPADKFFINSIIVERINVAARQKQIQGIVYINNQITPDILSGFKKITDSLGMNSKFVLLDDGRIPKCRMIHGLFEEVLFFERFRKLRITEAQEIPDGLHFDAGSEPVGVLEEDDLDVE